MAHWSVLHGVVADDSWKPTAVATMASISLANIMICLSWVMRTRQKAKKSTCTRTKASIVSEKCGTLEHSEIIKSGVSWIKCGRR
jgi:hypothetical protein